MDAANKEVKVDVGDVGLEPEQVLDNRRRLSHPVEEAKDILYCWCVR